MVSNGTIAKGEVARGGHPSEEDDLSIEFMLSKMKKVGYIDAEGYTVLPDYYNNGKDYNEK